MGEMRSGWRRPYEDSRIVDVAGILKAAVCSIGDATIERLDVFTVVLPSGPQWATPWVTPEVGTRRRSDMRGGVWARYLEFALLLPVTLIVPLGAFATLGIGFALVQQKSSTVAMTLFMLIIKFVAGILGLTCVWLSLLIPTEKFVNGRHLRIGMACGIVVGIVDAVYWVATLRSELNRLGPSAWGIWMVMLAAPIIVAIHQFVKLVRVRGVARSAAILE